MENKKINIAELLKDCPKGMELDCAIYENVTLVQVQEGYDYPIVIETPNGQMLFSKYGCFSKNELAKCVIFPKGKTTWEGFVAPYKFKDSDGLFHPQLYFNYIETMDYDEIVAPTISQVLKWLRKEKKIHICVDFDGDMNWYYQIAIYGSTDIAADGYGYNDYEISALAGIEYVLDNLI